MGLWQNLVAGYDENPELWKTFPVSSTTVTNNSNALVIILLSTGGQFVRSWMIPPKTNPIQEFLIPVSQESMSRTSSAIRPHPLFDQREYVFPSWDNKIRRVLDTEKTKKYRENLDKFSRSISDQHAALKIRTVYQYVSSRRNFDSELPKGTKNKCIILFSVEIPGDTIPNLWEDPAVFIAWNEFYAPVQTAPGRLHPLDFVTGTRQPEATSHPKKIIPSKDASNAKLISANDTANYTYRGIFNDASQAVSIGYESSQKAHQFLRYLIATNGIHCGEQVIVPFANRTGTKSLPAPPVTDEDEDWGDDEITTTADVMTELGANTGLDYAKSLGKALAGFTPDRLVEAHAPTAIAIVESATPGRLSVTYYRELARDEYLENVRRWHEACKWPIWRKSKDTGRAFVVFGAPSFDRILQAAFGWSKGPADTGYQKLKQRVRAQLIRSVFDNTPLPADFISNAVRRASNPLAVTTNGQFDRNRFLATLATTCALLKHQHTNTKESFDMSIDLARTDRDYLYGRLLGAADKLEEYALHKKDNSRLVTAAIRYMQTFAMRPFTTWTTIHDSLLPYKQQVKGCFADRELQTIENLFESVESYKDDSPLSGLYLIGYYHEREHIDKLIADAKATKQANGISVTDNQPKEN